MPKTSKALLIANVLFLVWSLSSGTSNAQRPPAITQDGVPFLPVNINPTEIPPMVNVNPYGLVPKVEVIQMPEIRIPAIGCDDRRNFKTAVSRSISGPLVVTFLNSRQDIDVSLSGGEGSGRRFTLSSTRALSMAIYLESGQRLDFDTEILYSGCQPG